LGHLSTVINRLSTKVMLKNFNVWLNLPKGTEIF
jgi:hypothetical protein